MTGTDIAYKLVLLLTRMPELTPDDFADAWLDLERRDPLDAPGLVRHDFGRPFSAPAPIVGAPAAPFDAVAETWWQKKSDAADAVVSRAFREDWLAKRLGVLAGAPAAVGGPPRLIWERELPPGANPVRIIVLPVARRRLTFDEFVEHWTGEHARIALGGPGTRQRLVSLEDTPAPLAAPSGFARTRYDGVGAITFESPEALAAEFSSPYYRDVVALDEPRFTEPEFSGAVLTAPVVLR